MLVFVLAARLDVCYDAFGKRENVKISTNGKNLCTLLFHSVCIMQRIFWTAPGLLSCIKELTRKLVAVLCIIREGQM